MQAIELKSKHRVCKSSKGLQRSVWWLRLCSAASSWQHEVTKFTAQPYLVIPSPDSILASGFHQ
jgi:hypothetical protein